jgi:hypothetical protein
MTPSGRESGQTLGIVLLPEWDDRLPWRKKFGSISTIEILRGSADTGLAVVSATAASEPTKTDLQAAWKARAGQSADPVLIAVSYRHNGQGLVALLGPDKDAVPVSALERAMAERLIEHALQIDSPTGLHAEMRRRLSTLQNGLGLGFRNEGLFATHVLNQQPSQPNWANLCSRSAPLLSKRGEELLKQLHYSLEAVPDGVILREATGGHRRAAAILLSEDESFDNPLSRFQGSNAVTHGLALARRESVPWLIVLGGSVARLFPVDPDLGVGRKGQTQTYIEIDLDLLTDSTAGFLTLFFAPESLAQGGRVWTLLAESSKYATGLSERLRDRIYADVIPPLSVAVANRNRVTDLPLEDQKSALDDAYHQTMIILFRLLFVAYAEDRGLLPLDINDAYTSNALKTLARRILDDPEQVFAEKSTSFWADLVQIWDVIDSGDLEGMGVPAYNGGLFSRDAEKYALGAAVYELRLTNNQIGPVLRGLLIDITPDGILGLVDFRSLDVREFGTIYEGLLASGLGIASTNLTVDSAETFIPASDADKVLVPAGSVYFHSLSGSRKATGSYFTKPFAVQHLLDQALEPAITEHLNRLQALMDKGATTSAAEALFEFRVADLSMGSAHFLVAAIDRIEARFSEFLILNPLPEVAVELHTLRTTAARQLGVLPEDSGIDDGMLLRRQIARRCIYGIDINEIAVELARLAVWIHTFVAGLPLSFLNHGLIHGNSLTGVGTLGEIIEAIQDADERETKRIGIQSADYFDGALQGFFLRASTHLNELAALVDASVADVAHASAVQKAIEVSLKPLAALCDLITAERTTRHLSSKDPSKIKLFAGGGSLLLANDANSLEQAVLTHPHLERSRSIAKCVNATHLAVAFPEVFRRDRPGFDVILGNPPWEKLHVAEDSWWGLRFPGLLSMSQVEKNEAISRYHAQRPDLVAEYEADVGRTSSQARVVSAGPYPGIGDAHLDLASAFCWRFWHQVRTRGRIGVVLPRAALSGAATAEWRKSVFAGGSIADLTTLSNSARWAFDMEPRYTIALVTLLKGGQDHGVTLRGPFSSATEYELGMAAGGSGTATVDASTISSWSGSAAIPLILALDVDVFAAMKSHPQFDAEVGSWRFRPVQGDANATKEKRFYDFNLSTPKASHKLPVWTGGTFNLWSPGSGEPYAYADPSVLIPFLIEKRRNQVNSKASAFHEMPTEWVADDSTLPMHSPRIAFRDVTNRTNTRTMICALIPGGIALVHTAPYLLLSRGTARDEAYLLGILSSIPFDWIARKFTELHMTFELLNSFPIPRVDHASGFLLNDSGEPLSKTDLRPVEKRLIEISGRLAAVDSRYNAWAKVVGVQVGSVKTAVEKQDLIAEVDALVSLLYVLSEDQVNKMFASFHRGWKYETRLESVLTHYRFWQTQISQGV